MQYISRLCNELQAGAPKCAALSSIFVGGGTPSLLAIQEWSIIFDCIRDNFQLASGYEWSMEGNPESLTPPLMDAWFAAGVNRISIGIQAFQPELRKIIGRNGNLDNLPAIARHIHASGIERLNFDFIFNMPGQTLRQWEDTLEQALEYAPTHISAYALTLEEGSKLAKMNISLDDDAFVEFWDATDKRLAPAGIKRYEISNFAIPGQECRHNLAIWKGGTYLGCGPAATSFDGGGRWTNKASIHDWLLSQPPELDSLPPDRRAAEILAFGMRLVDGWSWREFTDNTGFDPIALRGPQLEKLQKRGLLELAPTGARPTRTGLLFNDDIAMELL